MIKIRGKHYGEPENSALKTGWVGVVEEDRNSTFPEGTEVRIKNDPSLVNEASGVGPLVLEYNGEVYLVDEEKTPEPCTDAPGFELRTLKLKNVPR